MKKPKLFMLLLGCKPEPRHTEQHDTFFTIATDIIETEQDVKNFWPEPKKIHIDAWREVTIVDNYGILILPKDAPRQSWELSELTLFFLNLGGYKKDEFEEFHYKLVVVAKDMAEAIKIAKQNTFFKHHGEVEGASAHIDDKYCIGVDDHFEVKEMLPTHIQSMYRIAVYESMHLIANNSDVIHQGYMLYEKMKKA